MPRARYPRRYASSAMIDDGEAIHYAAVSRGTPVFSSDGAEVGKVDEVVDNYREHILDGIVIETPKRELLFVDAPEVARTAERGVTLAITAEKVAELPHRSRGRPCFGRTSGRGAWGASSGAAGSATEALRSGVHSGSGASSPGHTPVNR